ncbi:hypothetical protein JQS43_23320 [Natronosporangium hydrolyticum]|uniref:Uncharacterized protein n=1 Tax=Natronosporangium hydrolyticum TaxID=2811111 RepID=A0A895YFY6_9ACTN|nr:hypothetical protein [Natronosporangium hydrolyticum]QSB14389.1 hypothetical protein JQS43_23320 [Natronosporangium hydrolyticum]
MSRVPFPNPTGAATRHLLRLTVPWVAAVFAVLSLGYAVITVGIAIWGKPEHSVWASVHWVAQWTGFPAGIFIGAAIPVLVAHGVSRHHSALAAGRAALLIAAGMSAAVWVGLVVEWTAHRVAGLPHRIDGSHLYANVGELHLVFTEYFLIFAAFIVAGWLVAAGYLRLGPRWGTVALPLTFAPGPLGLAAIAAGWRGPVDEDSPGWVSTAHPLAAVSIAAAVMLAGLAAAYLTNRRAPIK